MSKSGTVKLISKGGSEMESLKFKSVKQRHLIIEDWIEKYGDKIDGYYFHILPDTIHDPKPKKEIVVPAPTIRPPAIYSNRQYI